VIEDSHDLSALEPLFLELAPLSADARARRLAAIEQVTARWARSLRELLAAHDLAIRRDCTRTEGRLPSPSLGPGTSIGGFQITRYAGGGSAAEVFEARRLGPVEQRVAIKILRPGMGSVDLLARFEDERETLAQLDHPGIAPIIDAGVTHDGRPWFAMPFVQGAPLTAYASAANLSMEQRVELFRSICDAIAYTHRRGIIHRDLTPSNIMVREVDGRPRPVIVDFGIAKAMSRPRRVHSELHVHRKILGTPSYMAPEQTRVGMAIGPTADVFSLGVLMHELLTGRVPLELPELDTIPVDELYRRVRETPRRVRTDPGAPRELDWIMSKAMELTPDRRYADAAALLEELDRFTRHEVLAAGPRTTGYAVATFLRRHRLMASTVALAILILIAGATATSVAALRARRAEVSLERRYSDVLELIELQSSDLVDALFLIPNTVTARKRLLEHTIEMLRRLAVEHDGDPHMLRTLGRTLDELARVLGDPRSANLGETARSIEASTEVTHIWERIAALDPSDPAPFRHIAVATLRIGNIHFLSGPEKALPWYERASHSADEYLDRVQPGALHPANAVELLFVDRQLVRTLLRIADDDPAQAPSLRHRCEAIARDSEARMEMALRKLPVDTRLIQQSEVLLGAAEVCYFAGLLDDAERIYRSASDMQSEALRTSNPSSVDALTIMSTIRYRAKIARERGDAGSERQLLEEAIARLEFDADPTHPRITVVAITTRVALQCELAEHHQAEGDTASTLAAAVAAVESGRKAVALEPENDYCLTHYERALVTALSACESIMRSNDRVVDPFAVERHARASISDWRALASRQGVRSATRDRGDALVEALTTMLGLSAPPEAP